MELTLNGHLQRPEEAAAHDVPSKEDNHVIAVVQPHSLLPKPEAPLGSLLGGVKTPGKEQEEEEEEGDGGSFRGLAESSFRFLRDRSSSLSASIAKTLSAKVMALDGDDGEEVTEIDLKGLKVVVRMKTEEEEDGDDDPWKPEGALKGRISFYSRSNCRDCTAVRRFFREKGLKFVEINVDVFPSREKELIQRTGNSQVPQIFFNEKLFGGLVALNSLRNSGDFDRRVKEMLGRKCTGEAPAAPVYGFDDEEDLDGERPMDEMVGMVRVLRQRLPIQDRLTKMKIVKNCFSGAELVEVLIHHLDCGRKKAVEIGKELVRRHFIHHVFGENNFEDGNHFYRFLEHEPFIPKCFNFRGCTNDRTPKKAADIGTRMTKIMSAILESYASDDRRHLDYAAISKSEEFRRYVNLSEELHRVDLFELSPEERMAFFLNLHNAMVIHAVIMVGLPEGIVDRRSFNSDFLYVVGGYPYSTGTINNGILRNNRRPPYSLIKPFGNNDQRLELVVPKVNPLVHFGLCNGTRSSPTVRFFSPQGVEAELRCAAREFLQNGGMEVDLDKRTVKLTRIIKWFSVDFGHDKEILRWVLIYLDATRAGLLTHLLSDGGPINIAYQKYDWSVNA
ncbi:hypothetical protein MLD38_011328 [Melastoma candidum]|uniref:Uncharacterized protein n=1 Tax=Melastoma candidum TaxID=119954 RepID=A0ACB9R2P2_9MYRT|nr:hypothetical protein MLD38_011328 [Melastoma candidum]